jgi:hypothetical protein
MFDSRLTLRLGAAVSLLLIAAVVFVLQVDFRDLGETVHVQVYLKHPGPLRAEADVQLAGRKIGRVDYNPLLPSHESRSNTHAHHPEGGGVLEVLLRKKYLPWVRTNSELFVNSKGLIGEAYLEVTPPPAEEPMGSALVQGDQVRGIDPARMEHIIVTSFLNARRFGALLDQLQPSMDKLKLESALLAETLSGLEVPPGTYASLASSAARAQVSFGQVRAKMQLEGSPSLGTLQRKGTRLLALVRGELADISSELDLLELRIEAVQNRLPPDLSAKYRVAIKDAKENLAKVDAIVAKLEDLAERVAAGQGTIGALMNDPEFSDDAKKLGRYLKRHPWKLITRPTK